jgi:hypothetical protein
MLAACVRPEQKGVFIRHFQNEYSNADDTISVEDGIVTRRTGFNKIRNGKLRPREYEVERWRLNEVGTSVIMFQRDGIIVDNSMYQKID